MLLLVLQAWNARPDRSCPCLAQPAQWGPIFVRAYHHQISSQLFFQTTGQISEIRLFHEMREQRGNNNCGLEKRCEKSKRER